MCASMEDTSPRSGSGSLGNGDVEAGRLEPAERGITLVPIEEAGTPDAGVARMRRAPVIAIGLVLAELGWLGLVTYGIVQLVRLLGG